MTHPIDLARAARRRRRPTPPAVRLLADIARTIGIDPATMRQRALRGTVPGAYKIGQVWVVDPATAEELEAAGRGRSIAPPRRRQKALDTTAP